MSNKEDDEKLRINPWRIILIFIGLFILFEAIFYVSFQYQQFWPLESSFYFYTPCLAGISILFAALSITQTYYVVDRNRIVHVKMGKAYQYFFNDIIFVDEKWSEKHKMLLFYQKDGKARYLAFDKKGVIYQAVLERSHLISEEEFLGRFPNVKL